MGGQGEEATELHIACFMGLVSFLASRPEALRVTPRHKKDTHNAFARANIQSATVTSSPLTDAGLDGTGEVVQVGWGIAVSCHISMFGKCVLIAGPSTSLLLIDLRPST